MSEQADISALRQLAKARGRELRRLQALLQDVAQGRTDVETYLVTSLRMVKHPLGDTAHATPVPCHFGAAAMAAAGCMPQHQADM